MAAYQHSPANVLYGDEAEIIATIIYPGKLYWNVTMVILVTSYIFCNLQFGKSSEHISFQQPPYLMFIF